MMAEREKEEASAKEVKLTEAELKLREEAAQLEASRAVKVTIVDAANSSPPASFV